MGRSVFFWGLLLALSPFVLLSGCSCNGPGLGNCPAEVCNGVDDDCDGETDEDPAWGNKGETCFVGQGACQAAGVFICDETDRSGSTVCSGAPGGGGEEICNGIDDDCDGETDEAAQWANRGEVCRVQEGGCVGVGIFVCDELDATGATVCDAMAGPPTSEVCDGFDNDCDGQTDEGSDWADLGDFCSGGIGACARPGLMACDPADATGPTRCNALPSAPGTELCNGLDDDCDGETDEGTAWADKGEVCTSGLGICETPGIRLCDPADPAGPTLCSASQRTGGSPEVCDGLDNDCDGQTDEDAAWADKGTLCSLGTGACQRTGVLICNPTDPAAPTFCNAVAGTPGPEVCDRVDNDCDGQTDEEAAWADLGSICRAGSGACETVGVKVCDTSAPSGATVCSVSAGAGGNEVCNGLDDDCDGQTDEDAGWADKGTVCTVSQGQCGATGTKVCDTSAPGGPTVCSATAGAVGVEVCNGLDDDCDGQTDEGLWADKGTVCVNGAGTCENTGTLICDTGNPAGPTVCSAVIGTPGSEVCNGLDDDCDGQTDEGSWGDKGTGCTIGEGQCLASGVRVCDTGNPAGATVCSATTGTPGTEVCNGLDDDCDGQTDEESWGDKGSICTAGSGACQQTGIRSCDTSAPSGPTVCSVGPGAGGTEVCNGIDDDCDGETDETSWSDLGVGCIAGDGVCAQPGIKVCDTGNPAGPTVCSATPGTGSAEVCNGIDDDCDSQTDELSWSDKGQACSAGQGICLAAGIRICDASNPAGPTVCSATAGIAGTEICNGLDDDCNGSPDDGLSAPSCASQSGACAGSEQTCGGPFGWRACSGAEYGADYEPVELSCDGIDNDCDGATDGSLPALPCSNQTGVCAGALATCGGGSWGSCGAAEYGASYQVSEITCDAEDNDCDGITDEGWLNGATGKYDRDEACGSCFIDCTQVFDRANAWGSCDASGIPQCAMACCTVGDAHAACDGSYDYLDLDGVPGNGCEFRVDASVVFVSTPANGGVDSGGCGGQTSPCATIGQGLVRAAAQPSKTQVHVSSGAYYENVSLLDGLVLLGGYNPVNWGRDPAANTTAIYGGTGAGHRKAVIADGITVGATLDGFVIYGANASTEGANSYGIWIRNSSSALAITNNTVWGAEGGVGTDGFAGSTGDPGGDGADGLPAYDTLTVDCAEQCAVSLENPGGLGGANNCDGLDTSGGAGGRADCPDFDEFTSECLTCAGTGAIQTVTSSGLPGPNGGGGGGLGGCDSLVDESCGTWGCGDCFLPPASSCPQGNDAAAGVGGGPGSHGTAGIGCTVPGGSVVAGEWVGGASSAGGLATPARGGGGGGAGGGVETYATAACGIFDASDIGGSGGGGGGGGCGGGAGTAGSPGGGSFALFVIFTSTPTTVPVLAGNELNPGAGGRGGVGGTGGMGGAGGLPGQGGDGGSGAGDAWCAAPGFPGGVGGDGGHGGGGGGGCGGASYGIFATGQGGVSLAAWNAGNTVQPTGVGGPGGVGGGSGAGGNPGSDGVSGAVAASNF